jgi:hypothetical protein
MNNRAISEYGLLTIIMGVIAAIAILATLPIVSRTIFGSGGEARTAEVALDALSQAVYRLNAEPSHFVAIRNFPLFIQSNGYMIVSFNSGDDQMRSDCYDETVTRPKECLPANSCLCLYEDTAGKDFDSDITTNPPIRCTIFPQNTIFLGSTDEWNFGRKSGIKSIDGVNSPGSELHQSYQPRTDAYENLLLYGQCDNTVWNNQKTYIEKISIKGMNYFYIARETAETQQRFGDLSKKYMVSGVPSIK